jgi:hypothetical protein
MPRYLAVNLDRTCIVDSVIIILTMISISDSFLRNSINIDEIIGSKHLIHVSYTTISSPLSPFYCSHATEVILNLYFCVFFILSFIK